MAIFTRFGSEVAIIGDVGEYKTKEFDYPVRLIEVLYAEDKAKRYLLAHTLRADNGWQEIEAAIQAAPKIKLEAKELRQALLR